MTRPTILCALLLAACATGPGAAGSDFTMPGEQIGEPVVGQSIEGLAAVYAAPAAHFDKTLLVEGTIKAVCQSKGCWMQIEDQGVTSMVRWETGCGGKYVFPKDAIGEQVVVQGSFYAKEIAAADKEHMEQESGGALTIPEQTYEMNASAVVMLDRKGE